MRSCRGDVAPIAKKRNWHNDQDHQRCTPSKSACRSTLRRRCRGNLSNVPFGHCPHSCVSVWFGGIKAPSAVSQHVIRIDPPLSVIEITLRKNQRKSVGQVTVPGSLHGYGCNSSRTGDDMAILSRARFLTILAGIVVLAGASLTCGQSNDFSPRRVIPKRPPITKFPLREVRRTTLNPAELVLAVTIEGESRAYPINMLTGPSREILNDELGGRAIAATW